MNNFVLCEEIRKVEGGFIIELRWPYGGDPGGYGEVICKNFTEVVARLKEAALEDEPEDE